MSLIRCTKKLQKEMGLKSSELVDSEPTFSFLGSWHANLIYIDRRKCVLFVNDKTLFNFIVPDVNKKQIQQLDELFLSHLQGVMKSEGFSDNIVNKIVAEYKIIDYANTNNKRVLGSMNDLAFHYKLNILEEGGVFSHAIPDIISKLNHMPMGAIKYNYSIDALQALYQNVT